jgi:hypothetical protein
MLGATCSRQWAQASEVGVGGGPPSGTRAVSPALVVFGEVPARAATAGLAGPLVRTDRAARSAPRSRPGTASSSPASENRAHGLGCGLTARRCCSWPPARALDAVVPRTTTQTALHRRGRGSSPLWANAPEPLGRLDRRASVAQRHRREVMGGAAQPTVEAPGRRCAGLRRRRSADRTSARSPRARGDHERRMRPHRPRRRARPEPAVVLAPTGRVRRLDHVRERVHGNALLVRKRCIRPRRGRRKSARSCTGADIRAEAPSRAEPPQRLLRPRARSPGGREPRVRRSPDSPAPSR